MVLHFSVCLHGTKLMDMNDFKTLHEKSQRAYLFDKSNEKKEAAALWQVMLRASPNVRDCFLSKPFYRPRLVNYWGEFTLNGIPFKVTDLSTYGGSYALTVKPRNNKGYPFTLRPDTFDRDIEVLEAYTIGLKHKTK